MSSKTALMFAGQGAQVVGMGKDLAAAYPEEFRRCAEAAEGLGFDLITLCFEGSEAELTRTEFAQPGIYWVSWLAFELLQKYVPNLSFDATAGLSLGEFTALAAARALPFEDGLKIVHQRGQWMQQACDATQGAMAAIIGLDRATTSMVCEECDVELANLNCPGQLVISGRAEGIHRACERAKALGAKRAMPLPVAGAYHSRLMAGARAPLQAALAKVELQHPAVDVISNVTATPHAGPDAIRSLLVEQVTAPVRWEDSIRYLTGNGFTRFIELGPGRTLSNFVKRIDRHLTIHHVADIASLETTAKALTTP